MSTPRLTLSCIQKHCAHLDFTSRDMGGFYKAAFSCPWAEQVRSIISTAPSDYTCPKYQARETSTCPYGFASAVQGTPPGHNDLGNRQDKEYLKGFKNS